MGVGVVEGEVGEGGLGGEGEGGVLYFVGAVGGGVEEDICQFSGLDAYFNHHFSLRILHENSITAQPVNPPHLPAQLLLVPVVHHQALIEGFHRSLTFRSSPHHHPPPVVLPLLLSCPSQVNAHQLLHLFRGDQVKGGFLGVADTAGEAVDGEIFRTLEAETVATGSEDGFQEDLKADCASQGFLVDQLADSSAAYFHSRLSGSVLEHFGLQIAAELCLRRLSELANYLLAGAFSLASLHHELQLDCIKY